jgi:cobalt-zinc-cadmium efflux system membrane fusion protein
MNRFSRYLALAVIVLVVAAVYWLLPASLGKAPSGHGEHGHGPGHGEQAATMSDAKMAAAGIELEKAGPQTLRETIRINGMLQPNQEALVQITPRFPGIVREVNRRVGDYVEKNELLAKIESNQSLTTYEMRSPFAGTIIDRQATLGEFVSEQKPAFTVANLSTVWADFAIHRRDLRRVKVGDTVILDPEDGGEKVQTKITYLSPVGASDTQSAMARAVIPNDDKRLRPGLFVTGRLVLSENPVPLAIKLSALQSMDNRTVVFVRTGEKFEPREVELGQRDAESAEVLFGLEEGDLYATRNSFVIKAEIGKASAAHDH